MDSKWNIGSLRVTGQAMFGDNNRMTVQAGELNVADPGAASEALATMSREAEDGAALSTEQKAEIQRAVGTVTEELKKPQVAQSAGVLKTCLDEVQKVAAAVPSVIHAALELKGLLGL
jgi:hypothetical protein